MKRSLNRYLYAIRSLKKKRDYVCAADVARHLGVKPPSVCAALRQLKDQDFITRDPDGNLIEIGSFVE